MFYILLLVIAVVIVVAVVVNCILMYVLQFVFFGTKLTIYLKGKKENEHK